MEKAIHFILNGKRQTIAADPERPLLDVLREDMGLTGSKFGCGEGECRACTVWLNGVSTPACVTAIGDVSGQEVVTIEGLSRGDQLHPAQGAFLAEGAFQCGYCTAGMVMGAAAVMKNNPKASAADVLSELQKHICRCGSYAKYEKAIRHLLSAPRSGKAHL